MGQSSVNDLVTFPSRLTSTPVTWAGWPVSSLEEIIMWSKWNWKVPKTPWGCGRSRFLAGKKVKASRFLDRSQPAWPNRRTARLRPSEFSASSPHRSVSTASAKQSPDKLFIYHATCLFDNGIAFLVLLLIYCGPLGLWKTNLWRCRTDSRTGGEKSAFVAWGRR